MSIIYVSSRFRRGGGGKPLRTVYLLCSRCRNMPSKNSAANSRMFFGCVLMTVLTSRSARQSSPRGISVRFRYVSYAIRRSDIFGARSTYEVAYKRYLPFFEIPKFNGIVFVFFFFLFLPMCLSDSRSNAGAYAGDYQDYVEKSFARHAVRKTCTTVT